MSGREIEKFGLSQGDMDRRGFFKGMAQLAEITAMANRHIVSNPRFFEILSEVLTQPAAVPAVTEPVLAAQAVAPVTERLVSAHRARVEFQGILGNPRIYAFIGNVSSVVDVMIQFGIEPAGVIESLEEAKATMPRYASIYDAEIANVHVMTGKPEEAMKAIPAPDGKFLHSQVAPLLEAVKQCRRTGVDPTNAIQKAVDTILNTPLGKDIVQLELLSMVAHEVGGDGVRILRIAETLVPGNEGEDLISLYQRLATAYAYCGRFDEALTYVKKIGEETSTDLQRFVQITEDVLSRILVTNATLRVN